MNPADWEERESGFKRGLNILKFSSKEMKIRKYILLMIYTGSLICGVSLSYLFPKKL